MKLRSIVKADFWDHEDIAAGPRKYLFNFRRIWKMSVLLTAWVTLAPLIFMTLVDYNVNQQAIEAEINYQTSRLVSNTRRSISFFLTERRSALNFIDKDNTYRALGDQKRLAVLLENLKKGFGGFSDIGVIDHTGLQIAYVGPFQLTGINYSGQEWFKEVQRSGTHVSEVFLGFRQQPHLVVAVKHDLAEGNFYILRASIDTQLFSNILAEVEVSGKGDIFLVNHQGVLQTRSRFFSEVLEHMPIQVPKFSDKTTVYETTFEGEPLVVGYAYIQETPYILMAVKKKNELMKPWTETRIKLIGFLGISVTFILVVIMRVSTYLVMQIYEADHKRIMTLHQVEYDNRMASLGRLSAGVAHEINNPLAIINEKAGLIKDLFTFKQAYAKDPKLMEQADSIIYSVERCAKITRRLLRFARHVDSKPQVLDLAEVIQEVLGFLGKEAEYRSITLYVDAAPDIPNIESDRGRLQEIFLNLINNSFAAMDDGGRLTVTIRRADNDFISVDLADTGCGIPETDLKRIFEPFFSTKTGKGGTGLGLSITYGLVQELGGSINVQSEVGKGTKFTVHLPVKMKPSGENKNESTAG